MLCVDASVALDGQMSYDFTSARILILRCVQSDLQQGLTCLNETESDAYFKAAKIQFGEPVTYIDYDNVEDPVKSTVIIRPKLNIENGKEAQVTYTLKMHTFIDKTSILGFPDGEENETHFMSWKSKE